MVVCGYTGTEFMAKLHEQLIYFVAKKVSTDRLWHGLRIYLSGHEVITISFDVFLNIVYFIFSVCVFVVHLCGLIL